MHTGIIGPFLIVESCAILLAVSTIQEIIVVCYKAHPQLPLPNPFSPIQVDFISKILVETGSYVEEAAVGYSILITVSDVEKVDLPSQSGHTWANRLNGRKFLKRLNGLKILQTVKRTNKRFKRTGEQYILVRNIYSDYLL